MSQDAKDFIIFGLQIDPEKRPTCEEMLNHKWMQNINIPENNYFEAENSQQTIFMVRAGIQVSKNNFI